MATAIHEQIKILAELQKIDAEAHRLKKELAAYPLLQQKSEADFGKKKSSLKAAEDELKGGQLKQKQKEGELQAAEEKIKKLQAQLYSVKTNKEYAAMELEIKGLKADKSLLEEDILRLLDSAEDFKSRASKEKEALSAEEKKLKDQIAELNKKAEALKADIAALEEKRKGFLPNLEPKIVSSYERILKGRDGLALVPVINGSCGGCHMELPPQTVNELQLGDKWITCESCARLLYWPA